MQNALETFYEFIWMQFMSSDKFIILEKTLS